MDTQERPLKLDYYSPRGWPVPPILVWVLLTLFVLGLSVGGVFVVDVMASPRWHRRSWLDMAVMILIGIPIGVVCVGIATVSAKDLKRYYSQLIVFSVVGTACVCIASYCLWAWCR